MYIDTEYGVSMSSQCLPKALGGVSRYRCSSSPDDLSML